MGQALQGSFSHSEDYIFLFSAAATAEHTLKRSLGLPGWSEKQKIAAHRFWCGIAELFTVESGEVLTDVEPMPERLRGVRGLCAGVHRAPLAGELRSARRSPRS